MGGPMESKIDVLMYTWWLHTMEALIRSTVNVIVSVANFVSPHDHTSNQH